MGLGLSFAEELITDNNFMFFSKVECYKIEGCECDWLQSIPQIENKD